MDTAAWNHKGTQECDVVDDTNAQDRDDLAKDSFLDATGDMFGSIDELGQEFGACLTAREIVSTTHVASVPEERFCERIRKDGNCRITHRVEIDPVSGALTTDAWERSDCLIAARHAVGPSVCGGEINLVEGASLSQCLDDLRRTHVAENETGG